MVGASARFVPDGGRVGSCGRWVHVEAGRSPLSWSIRGLIGRRLDSGTSLRSCSPTGPRSKLRIERWLLLVVGIE